MAKQSFGVVCLRPVQIVGETVIGYRIVLVPRTVIPIDKSSCSTVIPTTTGEIYSIIFVHV